MKKSVFISGLVIASLLLSACTGPQPQESNLKFNNGAQANTESTNQASQPTQSDLSSSNYQLNNTQVQGVETEGPKMKQLSDYTPIEATSATIKTTKGDITFDLYRDKAPITTINFLTLAKEGFYNDIVFHRVIPDFMAQVGDPLTKDPAKQAQWGTGGAGYNIPDEFDPSLKFDSEGIVAMANAGPNTGSSQIFITYEATPWLDGHHTIFGKVTSGMDVAKQLTVGDKIISVSYK